MPFEAAPKVVLNASWPPDHPHDPVSFVLPDQRQWRQIIPELGESSPRMTVVRHDRLTNATTLLIWTPPGFHVPRHWHSGNEKHMVVSGVFIFQCEGRRTVMPQGSFNYMPAQVVHEAWTPPDQDCLLMTDVDTLWDINWIDPPPGSPEYAKAHNLPLPAFAPSA